MSEKYDKRHQNLKPLSSGEDLSPEERERQREVRAKGAKAKGAKIAQRRTIREIYADLLGQPMPESLQGADVQAYAAEKGKALDIYESIAIAQAVQAVAGNTKAAIFVRDSVGDKPAEEMQLATGLTDGDRALLEKVLAMQQKDKSGNK